MLAKFGEKLSEWSRRFMPDPFLFALLLSLFTMVLGWLITGNCFTNMVQFWYDGFWKFLAFSMEMCLILVAGHALATSPPIAKLINKLADFPKDTGTAAMLVAFVAVVSGYLNWGFAIVVGALLARSVAIRGEKRGLSFHYPLLGAAGYMGLAVWHGGLSGSAPLKMATKNHELWEQFPQTIPVTDTIFSNMNFAVMALSLIGIPLLMKFLAPKNSQNIITIADVVPDYQSQQVVEQQPITDTWAGRLENSGLLTLLISGCGFLYIISHFASGNKLDLHIVIFALLFAGMLFHKTPINYITAISNAIAGCAGIILQFPFYAGISGMMVSSGLSLKITSLILAVATTATYPIFTFITAEFINIFIPSGGGQWIVQGDIVLKSAASFGVSPEKAIMAFAYGEQWTNLFQPFWAIALLGITGLKAGQIIGYCMAVMFIGFLFFCAILCIF